jgi:hypothetical protein
MGLLLALVVLVFGTGCSGGGGGGIGNLRLGLVDASTHDFKAVYVTIDAVEVHLGGNENNPNRWKQTAMPVSPLTVNLLALVNGVREDLGLVDLTAGDYTQMRLIIGDIPGPGIHPFANYVITNTNPVEIYELKIPSGSNTGFKIVNGFTINPGRTTELLLDFDACRSIVQAGNSGQWLLKPTVKVLDTAEYAIVKGRVIDDDSLNPSGINEAMVSIQTYDTLAADEKDVVSVVAATVTDSVEVSPATFEDGYFTLFVAPLDTGESYNLVVYKDGMLPDFTKITSLDMGETLILPDMHLSVADTGNVNGQVTIPGADPTEAYATLSFRQQAAFPGIPPEEIEIVTLNVLTGHAYDVSLPESDYRLVASTFFGFMTEVYDPVSVVADDETLLVIDFTTPQP